ncbi:MAG: hypothetical protein D6732_17395 [Methanobacteriota archaeon]|nr:MAG: hypothetical protein D6732_17395 [Euryarchaeota archaeon]
MNPFDIFHLNVLGRFLLGASGASVTITGRLIPRRIHTRQRVVQDIAVRVQSLAVAVALDKGIDGEEMGTTIPKFSRFKKIEPTGVKLESGAITVGDAF